MTNINSHTIASLKLWLEEFEKMIEDKNDILFLHVHLDNITREITTEIKLAKEQNWHA